LIPRCADLSHHEGSIPESWRKKVVRILRRNDRGTVRWTKRAQFDADSLFLGAFQGAIQDELASVLDSGKVVEARLITSMYEAGTVYDFLFFIKSRKFYSKINLLPDGRIIIIYSFHTPERDTL
jgi:hypothetical protein